MEDVGFTFDPRPFLNGLGQVSSGLNRMEHGIKKAFFAAELKVKALGLAVKGALSVMKQYMPEIGKSFEVAKDVFFKNFLWPLRQSLAPFLQGMLDWVRDHRADFVKWGNVLAGAFRLLVTLGKNLWSTLDGFYKNVLKPVLEHFFGTGSLTEMVNLVMTKLAVVTAWLSNALNVLFKSEFGVWLGQILKDIGDLAAALAGDVFAAIKSFLDAIGKTKVGEGLHNFIKALSDLFSDPVVRKGMADVTAWFGKALGTALTDSLNFLASVLRLIQGLIDTLAGKRVNWGEILGLVGESGTNFMDDIMNIFGASDALAQVQGFKDMKQLRSVQKWASSNAKGPWAWDVAPYTKFAETTVKATGALPKKFEPKPGAAAPKETVYEGANQVMVGGVTLNLGDRGKVSMAEWSEMTKKLDQAMRDSIYQSLVAAGRM